MGTRAEERSERQQETVAALLDAALDHLREHDGDSLTVRGVARRAGVTHTTAYAYFSSREHLVAELYWRQLHAIPHVVHDPAAPLADRVATALRGPGLLVADDPVLAHAGLTALLAHDADVARIRDRVGVDLVRRIEGALGPRATPEVVDTLSIAFSGAMLQAGMGYFPFAGVIDRMRTIAGLLAPSRGAA